MPRLSICPLLQQSLVVISLVLLVSGAAGAPANPAMDESNSIVIVPDGTTLKEFMLNKQGLTPDEFTELDRLGARPIYLIREKVAPRTPSERVTPNRVVSSPEHDPGRAKDGTGAVYNSVSAIESGSSGLVLGPDWTEISLNMQEYPRSGGAEPVRVGVLDTGADSAHPELSRHMNVGRNFVDALEGDGNTSEDLPKPLPFIVADGRTWAYGHGTHVSGVIAKLAPSSRIVPIRVLDNRGKGTVWTVLKGIAWALGPEVDADVLNLSLGSFEKDSQPPLRVMLQIAVCDKVAMGQQEFKVPGYQVDRDRCTRRSWAGAFVFAGAGNSPNKPMYPAALNGIPRLTSVTATDAKGFIPRYAFKDGSVDIAAPGDHINSAFPGGVHATMSGTSMATPWLSGLAAHLLGSRPRSDSFWTSESAMMGWIDKTKARRCGIPFGEASPMRAVKNGEGRVSCRR